MPRFMQIKGRDMNNTGLTLSASTIDYFTFDRFLEKADFRP